MHIVIQKRRVSQLACTPPRIKSMKPTLCSPIHFLFMNTIETAGVGGRRDSWRGVVCNADSGSLSERGRGHCGTRPVHRLRDWYRRKIIANIAHTTKLTENFFLFFSFCLKEYKGGGGSRTWRVCAPWSSLFCLSVFFLNHPFFSLLFFGITTGISSECFAARSESLVCQCSADF